LTDDNDYFDCDKQLSSKKQMSSSSKKQMSSSKIPGEILPHIYSNDPFNQTLYVNYQRRDKVAIPLKEQLRQINIVKE
jgi:hypothetical protein